MAWATRPSPQRYNSAAWKAIRLRVITEEPTCTLHLPGCTIRTTTADHIQPVATHPHLFLTRANLRGACAHCNTARAARDGATSTKRNIKANRNRPREQHPGLTR